MKELYMSESCGTQLDNIEWHICSDINCVCVCHEWNTWRKNSEILYPPLTVCPDCDSDTGLTEDRTRCWCMTSYAEYA